MKHILNNLTEEEKNSIREQHEGGMKVNTDRFKKLMESKSGDVKPLISEQVLTSDKQKTEGRDNPIWINLVSKLRNVSYPPKILTFNSYDTPPIPSQSLNWGTAKSPNGAYAMAIGSTDSRLPKEEMDLFNSEDRENQAEMHTWWKNRGYKTNDTSYVYINFKDADKLANDINDFFEVYPPEKK